MRGARAMAGATLAVGFFGAGFWATGGAARVSALVRDAALAPSVAPIPGSQAGAARMLVLDGVPARVRRCTAPASATLASVRDHYDAVARRECDCGQGRVLPHVTVNQGDVAFVLWTSPADGRRKGVIASTEAGVVRYTLVDGEPLPGRAPARPVTAAPLALPGGLTAPEGSRPVLSLEESGQGYACFETPGSSDSVAAALKGSLERTGYTTDGKVQEELDAVRGAAPHGQASRVVISFTGKDRKGFLVVAPERPGISRVTLALR